jgi:hypothetical protein
MREAVAVVQIQLLVRVVLEVEVTVLQQVVQVLLVVPQEHKVLAEVVADQVPQVPMVLMVVQVLSYLKPLNR